MSRHGQREIIFSILLGGGEILPLEEKQVESSASHAGIGEIEYRTEENDLLPLGNQREVEHIHNLAEQESERSTRSNGFRPDKTIKVAVDDVAHSARSNKGKTDKNTDRDILPFGQLPYPPTKETEKHDTENRKESLADNATDGHTECKSFIQHKMKSEPVPYHLYGFTQMHIGNDQNLDDLVNYHQ